MDYHETLIDVNVIKDYSSPDKLKSPPWNVSGCVARLRYVERLKYKPRFWWENTWENYVAIYWENESLGFKSYADSETAELSY